MGLFDKVLGGGNDKLNEAEGFAGIALCAVAADGVITEEEAAGLGTSLSRMNLYSGMSNRDVNKIFEKLLKVLRAQGAENLMSLSAAAVTKDLRPTAFAVATDLLMADGTVDAKEKRYLEQIQKSLDVSDDLAVKIVEVIGIKNRG